MDSEIVFLVEEPPEGGYFAKALGYPIFTESATLDSLGKRVKDAVRSYFGENHIPQNIRMHFAWILDIESPSI